MNISGNRQIASRLRYVAAVVEDCEGWLVNGTFNYCSECGAEVIK